MGCRDEPGGCQTSGTDTAHAGVWHGVLGMSLGAVHAWLRAVAHHAIKGTSDHVDGGRGWRVWCTVGPVAFGLAVGGRRFRFEDDLWDG